MWCECETRHKASSIRAAAADEPAETFPRFDAMPALPGTASEKPSWIAYFAGKKRKTA